MTCLKKTATLRPVTEKCIHHHSQALKAVTAMLQYSNDIYIPSMQDVWCDARVCITTGLSGGQANEDPTRGPLPGPCKTD